MSEEIVANANPSDTEVMKTEIRMTTIPINWNMVTGTKK